MTEICKISDLSIGYSSVKAIISDINLSVKKNCLISLIGPNGCGKSTLIKSLCGLHPILDGEISINGKSINKYSTKELSMLLSFVLSEKIDSGKLTVYDIISIGRHNYSNWWGTLDDGDKQIIERVLKIMNLESLANRFYFELSDGERQRVMIAKSLAQDTPIIILDEPTSHLDLPNRIDIFRLLKEIVSQENKSIILSTHELDLALTYSDKLWIINTQSKIQECSPDDPNMNLILQECFKLNNFQFKTSL